MGGLDPVNGFIKRYDKPKPATEPGEAEKPVDNQVDLQEAKAQTVRMTDVNGLPLDNATAEAYFYGLTGEDHIFQEEDVARYTGPTFIIYSKGGPAYKVSAGKMEEIPVAADSSGETPVVVPVTDASAGDTSEIAALHKMFITIFGGREIIDVSIQGGVRREPVYLVRPGERKKAITEVAFMQKLYEGGQGEFSGDVVGQDGVTIKGTQHGFLVYSGGKTYVLVNEDFYRDVLGLTEANEDCINANHQDRGILTDEGMLVEIGDLQKDWEHLVFVMMQKKDERSFESYCSHRNLIQSVSPTFGYAGATDYFEIGNYLRDQAEWEMARSNVGNVMIGVYYDEARRMMEKELAFYGNTWTLEDQQRSTEKWFLTIVMDALQKSVEAQKLQLDDVDLGNPQVQLALFAKCREGRIPLLAQVAGEGQISQEDWEFLKEVQAGNIIIMRQGESITDPEVAAAVASGEKQVLYYSEPLPAAIVESSGQKPADPGTVVIPKGVTP